MAGRLHFETLMILICRYCLPIGVLAPKSKKEITFSFKTDEAKVLIASFVIKVHEGSSELSKVLKMSAIGKYPFITLDQRSFDFETLLVGKTASQVFNLQNSALVPTTYAIESVQDDGKDVSIQVDHTGGEISPG